MWNYNGSITNNGTFNQNNSINITNNFNIRINLQEREASGKIYEYTLFCLHEYNKDEFNDIDKSVQVFANKINGNETKKMFDKIKRRNEDYGYQYPKNIDKYKEQLHDYIIWYLLNQRDLKLDMYYPEWKEDVNEI